MNPNLFEKIKRFYAEFDKHLTPVEGNVCKSCQCNECCTFAAKGGKHSVSQMEFDYIEEHYADTGYPQGSVEQFKEYLSQKKNEKGELIYNICPFFDHNAYGCSIYPVRPLSCRMYGTFFLEGYPIPATCYFKNIGKIVHKGTFLDEIPLALEFFELKSEHMGMRSIRINTQITSPFLERDLDDLPAFDMKNDPYVRACKLERNGKFEEALSAYEEANAKYPNWSFIPSCMGTDCLILKRFDEAVLHYSKAVSMRPANAYYHFTLAMACEMVGHMETAMKEYEEALALNPDNAIARASLAGLLHNKGSLQESLLHYEKAIDLDPSCAFYHFYAGVILANLNQLDRAEKKLKKAMELDPKLALAALYLGKIYEAERRQEEAKAMMSLYEELSKISS